MTEEAAQLCQDIEAGKAEGFANTAETDLQVRQRWNRIEWEHYLDQLSN